VSDLNHLNFISSLTVAVLVLDHLNEWVSPNFYKCYIMNSELECINRAEIAGNVPLKLTASEMGYPLKIIIDFFQGFDLEFNRRALWLALSTILCADDEQLGIEYTRTELRIYFEEIERLVEAAFCLRNMHITSP
jgi:hypothetical protein